MKKRTFFLAALLAAAVLGSAAFLWLSSDREEAVVAQIYQHGQLVREIRLDQVDEPYSFTLEGENGARNTVSVEPGRICVSEASCPDQVCVRQGWIATSAVPVVCLPNQVLIQIQGGDSDVDTATG